MKWGELWETLVIVTSLSQQDSDNTDISLNQVTILFKQRDKSSSLNFTQYAVLPHNTETVM